MATENGENDQANKELQREYHDLQNKITRSEIGASEGLDIANEKLDRVQRPQEAFLDAKIVFGCVRKIKEDADARRGRRSIFNRGAGRYGKLGVLIYTEPTKKLGVLL